MGCATEIETKEKKLRIEDAISATRAALLGGISEGGGTSYLKAKTAIQKHKFHPKHTEGAKVLADSLDSITRKIAQNSGAIPDVVLANIAKQNTGYNALADTYENLSDSGIIDPTLVITAVIQNATSAAATLLTTNAVIIA